MSKQKGNRQYASDLRRKRPPLFRRTTTLATITALLLLHGLGAFRSRLDARALQLAGDHEHLHYPISQVLYRFAPPLIERSTFPTRRPEDARLGFSTGCPHVPPSRSATHSRWNWPLPRFVRADLARNLFQYDIFSNQYEWATSFIGHIQIYSAPPYCGAEFPVHFDNYTIDDEDEDGRLDAILIWCAQDADGRRIARAVLLNFGRDTHEVQWACDIVNPLNVVIDRNNERSINAYAFTTSNRREHKYALFQFDADTRLYKWRPTVLAPELDPAFTLWSPPNGRSVTIPADRPIDEVLRMTLPELGPR